ncbi:MAG: PcfJ domain-containing protein [Planctomycetaceae bacterium]
MSVRSPKPSQSPTSKFPKTQLRQRYLRLRNQEPDLDCNQLSRQGNLKATNQDPYDVYCPFTDGGYGDWYPDVPFWKDEDWWDDAEEIDKYFVDQMQRSVLLTVTSEKSYLFCRTWAVDADSECDSNSPEPIPTDAIEVRLAEHLHQLKQPEYAEDCRQATKAGVYCLENLRVVKEYAQAFSDEPCVTQAVVEQICLFSPFWIRSPQTWDASTGTNLLEHLFVRYPVPSCLSANNIWSRSQFTSEECQKWLCWYILLGYGTSLRKASRHFGWVVSKGLQKQLYEVPTDCSPDKAVAYAEVLRLGGSDVEFRRLNLSCDLAIDLTMPVEESFRRFWQATVRWLIAHRDQLSDDNVTLILPWAVHMLREHERAGGQEFSWKGRSPEATLQRANEYQRTRYQHWSPYKWKGRQWNWSFDEGGCLWDVVELTTGKELYLEGIALNHCVGGYSASCVSGKSAIFSLRCNGERCTTIEIASQTGEIKQNYGRFNRDATSQEKDITQMWHQEVVKPLFVTD